MWCCDDILGRGGDIGTSTGVNVCTKKKILGGIAWIRKVIFRVSRCDFGLARYQQIFLTIVPSIYSAYSRHRLELWTPFIRDTRQPSGGIIWLKKSLLCTSMIVIVLLYVIVKCFLQSFRSLYSSTQYPRCGLRFLNDSPGLQHQASLKKARKKQKKTTNKKRRGGRGKPEG